MDALMFFIICGIDSFWGGRGYPVRCYPIAFRLRDRKGRANQCYRFVLGVGTPRALRS